MANKTNKSKNSILKYFIFNLILFSSFMIVMEFIIKSSVKLVKTGLLVGIITILIPLLWHILSDTQVIPIVSTVILIFDIMYLFMFRNKIYKVYLQTDNLSQTDFQKFMSLFQSKSAVIIIYTKYLDKLLEYSKKKPMKRFLKHKNLIADTIKLKHKLRVDPFGNPTGIVNKAVIIYTFIPTKNEIKQYKILTIPQKV